jgi:hypothetical protein
VTDVLPDEAGAVSEATDVLGQGDANATTVLREADAAQPAQPARPAGDVAFKVVKSVVVVHTSEVVE